MFSFDLIYSAMSADGIPQIDQPLALSRAWGTAFQDVSVFLARLHWGGHGIRILGVETDALGH